MLFLSIIHFFINHFRINFQGYWRFFSTSRNSQFICIIYFIIFRRIDYFCINYFYKNKFIEEIRKVFNTNYKVNMNMIDKKINKKKEPFKYIKSVINIGFTLDQKYILETMITIASIMATQLKTTKIRFHLGVTNNFTLLAPSAPVAVVLGAPPPPRGVPRWGYAPVPATHPPG